MNDREAAELAERLAANWAGRATRAYTMLMAEKFAPWEFESAARGVERAIDTIQYLPSFAELRDCYMAEGGDLPDPGRRMSPPLEEEPPDLSEEEQAEVQRLIREARRKLAVFRASNGEVGR